MNSKLTSILKTIVNDSKLMSEFLKIESKDSMYRFFLKISGDLSQEEFEKEITNYGKQVLNSEHLEKIAGGLNKKNWITILSTGLIPLISFGSIYPVNAIDVKNDMLYRYISENKSAIKEIVTNSAPIAAGLLTFGSVLLINYLISNQLPDFEKLEDSIINLRNGLVKEKIREFKKYIQVINSKLIDKIKSKNLNIDTTNLPSKSGILIFNNQILEIVKNDSKYFKDDISCVVGLLDYLTKNAVKPPYRGLSNAGCYCYLNSAVQMLSADDELCDILSSDKKMKQCFENFKGYKDSTYKKYKTLDADIENFEHDAKAKSNEIVDMINDNLSIDALNECLPNGVVRAITSKNKGISSFYEELFNMVAYDNSSRRWMYESALRNQGKRVTEVRNVRTIVSGLFNSDDLKNRFNTLTDEYYEMYNQSRYNKNLGIRSIINGFNSKKEYNDYRFAISNFNNPVNKDVNKKLLDMIHFVNAKDTAKSSFGGKDIADVLKHRDELDSKNLNGWNWHEQNDAGEAILRGFDIPDFVIDTTNCEIENNEFNPANALKNHISCASYILVSSARGVTPNPHSVNMNLVESVTTDDNSEYELISFACHSGNMNRGHWWAVRKDKSGNWWECNDSSVLNAGDSESCLNNDRYKKGATVLLYKKIK